MASLMRPNRIRNRKLPLAYSVTNYIHNILLDKFPHGLPDGSAIVEVADILHHMKLASRASRPGLTVGFLRILCKKIMHGSKISLKVMDKCVVLDVRMNPTLSPTTTNTLSCAILLFLLGDRLLCFRGEAIFSMI